MSQQVVNFYNKLAPMYPVFDLFLGLPKKRLLARINREPKGSLLEIGIGRGDNLPVYKHGPVTGIDVSEGMLAFARKKAPEDCTLIVMDAQKLEFADRAFDYCVLSYLLSVVDKPQAVMDEVYRVLVPGGRAFILNHESTGPIREFLNKRLAPITRRLCFSAVFEMEPLVDPRKFRIVHKGRYGMFPSITMLVLEKQ